MRQSDEIKDKVNIIQFLEENGVKVVKVGKNNMCKCMFHDDSNPSMAVYPDSGYFKCFSCGATGSVIDIEMRLRGGEPKDAMKRLGGSFPEPKANTPIKPRTEQVPRKNEPQVVELAGDIDLSDGDTAAPTAKEQVKPVFALVATHKYYDAIGNLKYEIERHEQTNHVKTPESPKRKKTFRQFHFDASGKRVSGMDGVERLLYRLPEISDKKQVILFEGEKCVDAAVKLGWDATCNSGGSKAWLPALADSLTNKDVSVCADNDTAGEEWLASILKSLEGKAEIVRIVRLPKEYNDIADIVDAKGKDDAARILMESIESAKVLPKGYDVPCETVEEAFRQYAIEQKKRMKFGGVSLSKWLPSMSKYIGDMFPGDMVTYVADTGVGKTFAVLNASYYIVRPSVIFQLELTNEQLAERYAAIASGTPRNTIANAARFDVEVKDLNRLNHILLCKKRGLQVKDIAESIRRSALMFGRPVEVVYVDYIGLIKGHGTKRYERVSAIAEDLKTMAVEEKVVLVCTSQVHRGEGDKPVPPELHSARDSGSIEQSSQLVLGAWRSETDPYDMFIKILKATNGRSGATINCRFNGAIGTIQEREFADEGSRE
jgi:hypothetical protein